MSREIITHGRKPVPMGRPQTFADWLRVVGYDPMGDDESGYRKARDSALEAMQEDAERRWSATVRPYVISTSEVK